MTQISLPNDRKADFAAALLKNPKNAYLAAYEVFQNVGQAGWASCYWVNDPEVLEYMEALKPKPTTDRLPTKEEVQLLAFEIAADVDNATAERLKALELYAKLSSFIERPPAAVVNTGPQTAVSNVMIVPVAENPEEWELKLRQNQAKLIAQADAAKSR